MKRRYKCLAHQIIAQDEFELRVVQDEDIEFIRQWRNAQLCVLRQTVPISAQQQRDYFSRVIWPSMELDHPANIIVTYFHKGQRIGYGGMVHIAWHDQRTEMSFLTDPALIRDDSHYAVLFTRYISLFKELVFGNLRFHRIYTETFANRTHHIEVLEKNGFSREGELRDHIKIDNHFINSIIHGVINE
jgi:RimJ/RimL family protein N-acetyltransferase